MVPRSYCLQQTRKKKKGDGAQAKEKENGKTEDSTNQNVKRLERNSKKKRKIETKSAQ